MGFNLESADSLDIGGVYIDQPGSYHFVVDNALEPGAANEPAAKFECTCLSGTVEGCAGKRWDLGLFAPDRSKDDGDQKTRKLNTAFFVAVDLFDPRQLGQEREIKVEEAIGRQFLVQLERKMDKNKDTGKYDVPSKFLRVAYTNIYHVDDPLGKAIPKDEEALGMLNQSLRHPESYFDFRSKGSKRAEPVAAVNVDELDF
jgi:hypothetical protein